MDHVASRALWLALGAWLIATSVKAQGAPPPFGAASTPTEMAETMSTGLVPLFTAMGVGVLIMSVFVVIAVVWLRPRMPQLDA